ncbi:MAG: hypothetical protein NPMRth3_1540003 [Nitrosopumilales archaeon]|nr:MAG: hypothetical protein NPMRth3_1540003 [Nitrosopumilales archaeon]
MKTSVKKNKGINEFAKKLKELMVVKKKTKKEQDKIRLESELKDIVLNNMKEKVDAMLDSDNTFAKFLKKVQSKQIDPYEAADKVSKSLVK